MGAVAKSQLVERIWSLVPQERGGMSRVLSYALDALDEQQLSALLELLRADNLDD